MLSLAIAYVHLLRRFLHTVRRNLRRAFGACRPPRCPLEIGRSDL
jgi:hypothetical protein